MDKQQIIAFIEGQLATGKITKGDLMDLAGVNQVPVIETPATALAEPVKEDSSKNLIHVFYGIGAIIAIVGVGILVGQNWNEIGFAGRMIVTIGISVVTYIAGFLSRGPEQRTLSQVMFTISTALAPVGVYVLLNEASIDFTWSVQLIVALLLATIYGVALAITKRNILVLITAGFATWAYYTVIMKVTESYGDMEAILKYSTMLLGATYLFVGSGIKSVFQEVDSHDAKEKQSIQSLFYGLGTLAILGAGIFVGGMFDLFYIAIVFAAFYGSVYLKSRIMLTLGALFLMAHIIKLTSKYFVDSIGWPIALIGVGFLVIGIGYGTFYLNKKFIAVK